MRKPIPLFYPSMTDRELSAVYDVMKSGWIGLGPKVDEFEVERDRDQGRDLTL